MVAETVSDAGEGKVTIRVQTGDFDVSKEVIRLRASHPEIGAVVTFVGTVRDIHDGESVLSMELEHYPGMTEQVIGEIAEAARRRWDIVGLTVIHRIGVLKPTDQIVLVAVGTAHRSDAFRACEFIIDLLKTQVPFWKKEETAHGSRWVTAKSSDTDALTKW